MAKKKSKRRFFRGKKRHSRRSRKFPLIPIVGLASTVFVPSKDGWNNPAQDIAQGRLMGVGANLVNGWQPFYEIDNSDTGEGAFRLHLPRYLAILVGSALLSKGLSFLGVNRIFSNAPSPLNKLKL